MRPTIPLADWRLAVDLDATRALTAEARFPARGCTCDDCVRWAELHRSALPAALSAELRRVGVDPAHPSDVYTLADEGGRRTLRVTFHCVGRILAGPGELAPAAARSGGRNYVKYAGSEERLALAVGYVESFQATPPWATDAGRPLVAIDLWLEQGTPSDAPPPASGRRVPGATSS